jgi:hypothetical protein
VSFDLLCGVVKDFGGGKDFGSLGLNETPSFLQYILRVSRPKFPPTACRTSAKVGGSAFAAKALSREAKVSVNLVLLGGNGSFSFRQSFRNFWGLMVFPRA